MRERREQMLTTRAVAQVLLDARELVRAQLSLAPSGERFAVDVPVRLGPSGVPRLAALATYRLPKRAINRPVAIILPLHQRSPYW